MDAVCNPSYSTAYKSIENATNLYSSAISIEMYDPMFYYPSKHLHNICIHYSSVGNSSSVNSFGDWSNVNSHCMSIAG